MVEPFISDLGIYIYTCSSDILLLFYVISFGSPRFVPVYKTKNVYMILHCYFCKNKEFANRVMVISLSYEWRWPDPSHKRQIEGILL